MAPANGARQDHRAQRPIPGHGLSEKKSGSSTIERPQGIRIALLCRSDDPDAHFLQTVAANHGVPLQRFHDEVDALATIDA